jgi:CHASE1-domain containing sensor protein
MTKLPTIYLAVLLTMSCTANAAAQDRAQAAQNAVNNMARETVDCAAYFEIVSLALLHSNEGDTAQQYLVASKKALDRAESLSEGVKVGFLRCIEAEVWEAALMAPLCSRANNRSRKDRWHDARDEQLAHYVAPILFGSPLRNGVLA